MVQNELLTVEVAYATPDLQKILAVKVQEGSAIQDVILQSGIMNLFPEIDLAKQKVGIFSKPYPLSHLVNDGDRIEIYRPLLIDPKEIRRKKAKKT